MLCGLESRPWQEMVEEISRQIEELERPDIVELIWHVDNGEATSGAKRQMLAERSTGDYIAFVDDDDRLDRDYVSELVSACLKRPDIVTFDLLMTFSGGPRGRLRKPEKWSYGLYPNDRNAGKMSANHLCAWRRELALKVAWPPLLGYADDQLWYQPLIASGLVQSEVHIDKVLYYYQFSYSGTQNQRADRIEYARKHVGKGLRCFWWSRHPGEIFIEVLGVKRAPTLITVRDRNNAIHQADLSELDQFHVIKIA